MSGPGEVITEEQWLAEHGPGTPPPGIILAPAPIVDMAIHPLLAKLQARLSLAGMPAAEFIGSPNYYPGRQGYAISGFVQHTTVGTLEASIARFVNPAALVSSTWVLGKTQPDGSIRFIMCVPLSGGPYTNGNWEWNMKTLTLERVDDGDYNAPPDPGQRRILAIVYAHVHEDHGVSLVHRINDGFMGHKEVPGASTACPDGVSVDAGIADATALEGGTPLAEIRAYKPITGVVFDTPTNDRSFLDYNTVAYVPGQVAPTGAVNTWTNAKQVPDPATGTVKWLLSWDGSTWAVWADAFTSTGEPAGTATNPPDFVTDPNPKPPPGPDDDTGLQAQITTLGVQLAAQQTAIGALQTQLASLQAWARGLALK